MSIERIAFTAIQHQIIFHPDMSYFSSQIFLAFLASRPFAPFPNSFPSSPSLIKGHSSPVLVEASQKGWRGLFTFSDVMQTNVQTLLVIRKTMSPLGLLPFSHYGYHREKNKARQG